MFELDLRSRQPLYEQLMDKIKELIIAEVLTPDQQLPSVRSLAQQLTINPNTIQKAFRELEREGYLYTLAGRGNFVAPMEASQHQEKLAALREEISKLMSEALYLGMNKESLLKLVHQLDQESPSTPEAAPAATNPINETGGTHHD